MKDMNSFRTLRKHAWDLFTCAIAIAFAAILAPVAHAAPPATTTTALATSGSSVTAGSAVTLTATVTASSVPVTPGLVTFCDASALHCEGPSILGTAQLTSAGTASIKLVLGIGTHSVKAIFTGTSGIQSSTSSASTITVTGSSPTTTALASTGSAGNYTLTATLGYHGLTATSSGDLVSFIDTSNANLMLGSATVMSLSSPFYNFITIPSSPVSAGNFPDSQVLADFNGDGILDMPVANYRSNSVSIYAGDGKGGFSPVAGSPFTVGSGPSALAVADLNNDGIPDIIVANASSGTVQVLLAGSSGFTTLTAVSVGSGPQAIAVADFNQDGNADIAVANLLDSTISILLGDGTGHFTAGPTVSSYTGDNPYGIVSGDFNQDGLADLAIVNATDGTVSVLLGDGTGAFTGMTGSPFTVPSYPVALAAGDFNSDGKLDLAVASGTNNNVSILLNTGGGFSIPSASPYATGQSPSAVIVGDFNGDGKQDLAISNANENTCTLLLGDGTGAFSPASQSPLANFSAPFALAIGDVNGDGTGDLLVSNLGGNSISVRPLQITQSATATLSSISIPGSGTHLVAASFAGDSFYGASTSPTVSLAASAIQTTLTLTVTPGTTNLVGQSIQLKASLSPATASGYTAGGTITFLDGSTQIGQGTLTNGQATFSSSSLAAGPHSITASYSGNPNFASSTASAQTVTVSDFSLAATPTALTVASGKSGTFQITVTPSAGGFASAIAFSVSGLPTGATATFSPATLTPGSSAASTTLSITAAASTTTLPNFPMSLPPAFGLMLVAMLASLLSAVQFSGRLRAFIPGLLAAIILFGTAAILTGCSNAPGVQTKTSTVTVTATSGTLTHSLTATLNTQ